MKENVTLLQEINKLKSEQHLLVQKSKQLGVEGEMIEIYKKCHNKQTKADKTYKSAKPENESFKDTYKESLM